MDQLNRINDRAQELQSLILISSSVDFEEFASDVQGRYFTVCNNIASELVHMIADFTESKALNH